MTGLLYQDFCTAKGKWMLRILAACVLILIGMVIWGDPDGMAGALFLAILGLIAVYYGISIPEKIFASDEKNSIRTFLLSLPTGGRKYVQEKYAFMGIYYYTLANLLVVLQTFVLGGIRKEELAENMVLYISMLGTMLFLLVVAALFIAAVEFPFLFAFGSRAARYVKTALVVFLFFAAMVWLLFDPAAMEDGAGMMPLLEWMTRHTEAVQLLEVCMPAIIILLYFISYKGSVLLFRKRGEMYE